METEGRNVENLNSYLCDLGPSYKLQNQIQSALKLYAQTSSDINKNYCCERRFDKAENKLEPLFMPRSTSTKIDATKPCKLKLRLHDVNEVDPSLALLKYVWKFTENIEDKEIDLHFIKSLVDTGVDINVQDEHGQTILHAFVRDWHSDITLFAIRHNADVNIQDHYGRSPLHLAAALNNPDVAKILLKNGANPNIDTYKELQTPVHYAAKYNSVNVLKALIRYGGTLSSRDCNGRTVPFIAAEAGSTETVQFLLDIHAPFGAFDNDGNSALTNLIEKIPHLAFHTMGQFVTSSSHDQCEMYLSSLESDDKNTIDPARYMAKTPLESITAHNDLNLVMHPVIQKSIETKWKLFGRMDAIKKLSITFLYLLCWLVLAYNFSDEGEFYYSKDKQLAQHAWTIVFELLIILFASYFYWKDFVLMRKQVVYQQRWLSWKKQIVKRQYIYCHPAWPNERLSLKREKEKIKVIPSLAGKQRIWFVYEWVILLFLSAVIVTRILAMISDSKSTLILHKVTFGITMLFSFMRVLKIGIRFRYFSVFVKIASSSLPAIIQIGFVYIQVYIPFVAAFWLIYDIPMGESQNDSKTNINNTRFVTSISHLNDTFHSFNRMFVYVYGSSFGQEDLYKIQPKYSIPFQIFMSFYHILTTFIVLSIIAAFITAKFRINYKKCVAEASLHQSYVVLQLEKDLNKEGKGNLSKYYATFCNPLTVTGRRLVDEIQAQDAIHKVTSLQTKVHNIFDNLQKVEGNWQKDIEKLIQDDYNLLRSSQSTSELMGNNLQKLGKLLTNDFNNYIISQETISKYIPKLM